MIKLIQYGSGDPYDLPPKLSLNLRSIALPCVIAGAMWLAIYLIV